MHSNDAITKKYTEFLNKPNELSGRMAEDTKDDNSSNISQETFIEGWQVRSWMARRGIYSARACLVSKSHNENTNIKCNACDVMWLYQSLGSEVLILPQHIGIIYKYTRIY